jgi:hypothetical protein
MAKDIFQIPAILNKYESKANGAVKFTFTTYDDIRADLLATIISFIDNAGFLNFAVRKIEAEDLVDLPEIDPAKYDEAKSPSQRLRAVIFLYHQQKGGTKQNFREYYLKAMERLINSYKDKLE